MGQSSAFGAAVLASLLLLSGASALRWDAAGVRGTGARNDEGEFVLGGPEDVIKGSGGSFAVWDKNFRVFQDADVQAGLLTLEAQGLLLPKYTDSHQMHYVIEGCARAGLVTPLGIPAGIRHVRKGDVVVHPRGWVLWIWNNGNERMRLLSIADTSLSTERQGEGASRAEQTSFHLTGAQEKGTGGILHGFSEDVLAQAWDVDAGDVKSLLEGQKETAIIKVEKQLAKELEAAIESAEREHANAFIGDFVYNLEQREKDYERSDAGWISTINGWKSRTARKIGLAAARVHLEPNAMAAPRWVANSAVLCYVLEGQINIEVVYPDGAPALRREMKAGEVIVIPAGYARAGIASSGPFEGVSFALEHSRVYGGFLAGGNSVFRALPRAIQRAAFNVGDDILDKLRKTRMDDYILLPPAGGKKEGSNLDAGAAKGRFAVPMDFDGDAADVGEDVAFLF